MMPVMQTQPPSFPADFFPADFALRTFASKIILGLKEAQVYIADELVFVEDPETKGLIAKIDLYGGKFQIRIEPATEFDEEELGTPKAAVSWGEHPSFAFTSGMYHSNLLRVLIEIGGASTFASMAGTVPSED